MMNFNFALEQNLTNGTNIAMMMLVRTDIVHIITTLLSVSSLLLLEVAVCHKRNLHDNLAAKTTTSTRSLFRKHPSRTAIAFVGARQHSFDTPASYKFNTAIASNKASPSKTMDFLRRIGKVGSSVDTECLIGVDEGNTGGCTSSSSGNSISSSTTKPINQVLPTPPSSPTPPQSTQKVDKTQTMPETSKGFRSCVETGIIDDMTHEFPYSNTGSRWDLFTYVNLSLH
jgi:hypothetical protein